ncbi:Energy-coupling factor transporter ATP-binding protein EcfA 1 [Propionispora sp. 2/2-37]|uniref:energy-coupling factor transporter ATPase n=1 Tax=Propionispora sp. 2/2-37 TaxID=1677858 RepID=UPI0006BB95D2|nr:energy-coupling factor transporter ATPase [Propionispora sp. 2/2-37]CUH95181.1 Energy-coupling factor transporter ATP-binding protein EcfA 1 [Propionispora sp. 2/2-37]
MSIVLHEVTHVYMQGTPYQRVAIENINLEIKQGEFVGIIGHTGSGKSTLIQHLNGLLKPTSGEVLVEGVNLAGKGLDVKQARQKIGMVFQYPEHQLFEETIYDDIAFGPRNLGLLPEEVERRVRMGIAFAGLDFDTFAKRSPFQLSGGQMRRVAIAGVIAMQPEYLILDEPSAGLDPRGRNEIFEHIRRLYQETGITVILVSHQMEEIASMANRLIVMHHGHICQDGEPRTIFTRYRENLKEAGVDVPPVTALLATIKAKGLAVDDTAITLEEGVATIAEAVRGRK